MQLQTVMQRFIALEYSLAWGGPRHPKYPNKLVQSQIDEIWDRYPSLRRDQGYIDFLEIYGGAIIIYPDDSVSVIINGIWDYSQHILYEEGSFDGDHILFSEVLLSSGELGEVTSIAFAFKLAKMPGIYRYVSYAGDVFDPYEPRKYEPYCNTFVEWLDRLVKFEGRLID